MKSELKMNGAESLVRTLVHNKVDVCFSNPGTSEMHFVGALDKVTGIRCVLGLFEGVITGAADGYFRMSGKPASTLLHLGPGLAKPGPKCNKVEAGFPLILKYPSAAPVITPSNKPSTHLIPVTLSKAPTKCISDVPGLEKQTSTLLCTRVLTKLSAPFIFSSDFIFYIN